MSWTRPTIIQIYERIRADMESRVTADIPIPSVSMLGVLAIVFTGAVHLFYGFLVWVSKQVFVDTATIEGLERWGNILGLPRKAPEFSTGEVAFTGTAAKTVVTGTVMTNGEGYEYETTEDFIIGTTATVPATSLLAGATYNTDETIFELSSPDPDIDTPVVAKDFDDGTDIETLVAWALRLLQRFRNPPSSGTVADYERWALKVSGVNKAKCYPAEEWGGAGTVGLAIAETDWTPVVSGIKAEVVTYIDSVKPIPAEVTVFDTVELPVIYSISLSPNTVEMQSAVTTALQELHALEGYPGSTLLISRIRTAIASAGPDDYIVNYINVDGTPQGATNVVTVAPDVPIFNSIIFVSL